MYHFRATRILLMHTKIPAFTYCFVLYLIIKIALLKSILRFYLCIMELYNNKQE